jgi:hypothetical protein
MVKTDIPLEIEVRALALQDRKAWEPLWQGYQEFYRASLSPEQTELT